MPKVSNQKRINFLKDELNQGHYVILLGSESHQQHYLVVIGVDSQEGFHLYDPLTGQRTINDSDLLKFWSSGGLFGFYRWLAIAAS